MLHLKLSCEKNFDVSFKFAILCRDLAVELPFTLTHPKPPETPPPSRPISVTTKGNEDAPIDTNLIQLDTK